jgi:hypothetical protein
MKDPEIGYSSRGVGLLLPLMSGPTARPFPFLTKAAENRRADEELSDLPSL